jgi:hypothetical protein
MASCTVCEDTNLTPRLRGEGLCSGAARAVLRGSPEIFICCLRALRSTLPDTRLVISRKTALNMGGGSKFVRDLCCGVYAHRDTGSCPWQNPYPNEHIPWEKLPGKLQKIIDDGDTLLDHLYDGKFVI